MLKFLSPLVAAILAVNAASAAPIKVFALMGQSNAGDSAITFPGMDPVLLAPQENLYQYSAWPAETFTWDAMAPHGSGNKYFGAELSFAHAMSTQLGEPVAVIKVSYSGTSLWYRWLPDPSVYPTAPNDLYAPALAKVQTATAGLVDLGYEPTLAGIMWIQGEGDANTDWSAMAYDDNLLMLVDALRTDLNAPDVPFLYNQLHVNVARNYPELVRESQVNAAALGTNMHLVNIDDLSLNVDSVHFPALTQIELGRRFAAILAPVAPPLAAADFNADGCVDGSDLLLWQDGSLEADANLDGLVDGADFLLWQQQVDVVEPPIVASVPEPGTLVLACLTLIGMAHRARMGYRRTNHELRSRQALRAEQLPAT